MKFDVREQTSGTKAKVAKVGTKSKHLGIRQESKIRSIKQTKKKSGASDVTPTAGREVKGGIYSDVKTEEHLEEMGAGWVAGPEGVLAVEALDDLEIALDKFATRHWEDPRDVQYKKITERPARLPKSAGSKVTALDPDYEDVEGWGFRDAFEDLTDPLEYLLGQEGPGYGP